MAGIKPIKVVLLTTVAVLMGVLLPWLLMQGSAAPVPDPPPSRWDEQLLAIDDAAIEQAYRQHVVNMFLTWMKDSTGQPGRAINGTNQARHAFIAAKDEIEKRRVPMPPVRPR